MPPECWNCGNATGRYDKFCCKGCEEAFEVSPPPPPAFIWSPPKRESKPVGENVKLKQKPLFLGGNDLPGQSYLFGG